MKSLRLARALAATLLLCLTALAFGADESIDGSPGPASPGPSSPGQTSPQHLLDTLNGYPHAMLIASSDREVVDHELGLGALQKVRGAWRFKQSERISGRLQRFTWQVTDGFTSEELFEGLSVKLASLAGAELLFSCQGRACGHGSQWANRVFGQRILYGRDDLQRYSVYTFVETQQRVVIYASSRTSERQYLHVDLIEGSVASD